MDPFAAVITAKRGATRAAPREPRVLHDVGGIPENMHESWVSAETGELHRLDGPALIESGDGWKKISYYAHGMLHRLDGPALERYIGLELREQGYYRDGELHREDGPAQRLILDGGGHELEAYYEKGNLHREDFPAKLTREYGIVVHREYWENGEWLRVEGPSRLVRMRVMFKRLLRRPRTRSL